MVFLGGGDVYYERGTSVQKIDLLRLHPEDFADRSVYFRGADQDFLSTNISYETSFRPRFWVSQTPFVWLKAVGDTA